MKIDYFCFSVPCLGITDYVLNEEDSENTLWVKSKEIELMDLVRKNNMLIVFDRTTKKFYNEEGEVDIEGKVIFPRSFIPYREELLKQIEANNAISIETLTDSMMISHWPRRVQPLHRAVIETTYREFVENHKDYKTVFDKIFLKTAKKSRVRSILDFYGEVEIKGKKYFTTKPYLWNLELDDEIFVSDVCTSIEDVSNGVSCKEYRVFVVGNRILSVSRSYVDYPTQVPDKVIEFIKKQVNRLSFIKDFPSSYVLDVGEILVNGVEVIDIIEFNSICSSGLEVSNLLEEDIISLKSVGKNLKYTNSNLS